MKCIIIYYSLTGSTKKIAQQIYEGMKPLVEKCDLAVLKDVNLDDLGGYDLIGLGSLIISSPPENIRDFLANMPSLPGKHCFVFCTHGSAPEYYFPRVVRLLGRKGLTVIGTADWYGSCNYAIFPKPYFTDGHPDDIDLKEAEDFGRVMVERSCRISNGETDLIPPIPPMPPMGKKPPRTVPGGLKLNMKKCRFPECRLCMDNCPWDDIDLSVSPPVFAQHCVLCCFCEMICPQGAIEADYDAAVKIHMPIVREVIQKEIDEAEAKGRFRRLVPKNKIGWDTPFYKVFDKHPRYVISEDD